MVETDLLKAHIQKRLSISNDDLEEFCQSFKVSKVKKAIYCPTGVCCKKTGITRFKEVLELM
jgi:rhodanese-related sulfurtransferase